MYAQTKHPTESFCVYAKPILRFNIDCGENDFSVERSGIDFWFVIILTLVNCASNW